VVQVVLRLSLVALCSLIAWRTSRIAVADFLAHDGIVSDFDRAISIEPEDESLLAGRAIFQSDERALKQAVTMNPRDVEAWMTLGLLAESRGDPAEAEGDLIRAVAVDHTFKPSWTLANYYFRSNQPEKFRAAIARCLSLIEPHDLQPMSFDPVPVFDLCWRQTGPPKDILALIPRREQTLVPYLKYLYESKRTDAALEAWPGALAVANDADPADADALIGFDEHLIGANRIPEAVVVWNELARRRLARPGSLELGRGFSWHVQHQDGAFVNSSRGALKFEFTGDEPEDCELLWKIVPVSLEERWKLVWRADPSRFEGVHRGLRFQIGSTSCPLEEGSCEFRVVPGTQSVRLSLRYARAPGTTRVKGILLLSTVRMEPNP
jgi:tetratricopeptide (TPR) repeat protein